MSYELPRTELNHRYVDNFLRSPENLSPLEVSANLLGIIAHLLVDQNTKLNHMLSRVDKIISKLEKQNEPSSL